MNPSIHACHFYYFLQKVLHFIFSSFSDALGLSGNETSYEKQYEMAAASGVIA